MNIITIFSTLRKMAVKVYFLSRLTVPTITTIIIDLVNITSITIIITAKIFIILGKRLLCFDLVR